jgi:outer membrane lipoprotein LolB
MLHSPLFPLSVPLRFGGLCLFLCALTACRMLPSEYTGIANPNFAQHQGAVLAQTYWQLDGRLNVRQPKQSDTVAIHWQQQGAAFDVTLRSSVLGLGTTQLLGNDLSVTLNRAGQASVQLPNLQALTAEYLQFEFPADYLFYWVRGLPVPELPTGTEFDAQNLLTQLKQRDPKGRAWELQFDRYADVAGHPMPGRIRVALGQLQLTFVNLSWQFNPP